LNKLFIQESLFYSVLTNLKVPAADLDIVTIFKFLKEILKTLFILLLKI